MAETVIVGWERVLMAAEKVKERLRRATRALNGAGVPYAVVGGNAVAEWVARIDDEAVRNTRDVDLLVRRAISPRPKRRSKPRASSTTTGWTWMCSSTVRKANGRRRASSLRRRKGAGGRRVSLPRTRRIRTGGRVPGGVASCLGADEAYVLAPQGPHAPTRHDPSGAHRRDVARASAAAACRAFAESVR